MRFDFGTVGRRAVALNRDDVAGLIVTAVQGANLNLAPIDTTMAVGTTNIIVRMVGITTIGTTTKPLSIVTNI